MAAAIPALVPLGHHAGKAPIPLGRPVMLIGSRSNARIHLISSTVSKAHALLVVGQHTVYLHDLASREHVYVNGERVLDVDLSDGDLIKIGSFTFRFEANGKKLSPEKTRKAPPASLTITGAPVPVPIEQRVMLIGKRSTCDIPLLEDSVSTAHAVIFELDGQRYVRDLGSRTGTFVNEVSTHQHELRPGDVIRVGETDLCYALVTPPSSSVEAVEEIQPGTRPVPHVPARPREPAPSAPETRPLSADADELLSILNQSEEDDQPQPVPQPVAEAVPPPQPAIEPPSAGKGDERHPLSGTQPGGEESLSPGASPADTSDQVLSSVDQTPAEDKTPAPLEPFDLIEPPSAEDAVEPQEPAPVDLDSRGGWRSPWSVGAQDDQTPNQPVDVQPVHAADADDKAPTDEVAEDDVLRFDDDKLEKTDDGAVAVIDQDTLKAEAEEAVHPLPFDEAEFEQEVATPPIDLAAALEVSEPQEPPVGVDELAGIDFSSLDEPPATEPASETHADEVELHQRLLDLPPEPQAEPQNELRLDQPPDSDQPAVEEALDEDIAALEARVQAPAEPTELAEPATPVVEPDEAEPQSQAAEQPPPSQRKGGRKPKSRKGKDKVEESQSRPRRSRKPAPPPVVPVVEQQPEPAEAEAAPQPQVIEQAPEPSAEVVAATEPTPESALPAQSDELVAPEPPAEPAPAEMSDTMLGRAVQELSGDYQGDLVEEAPPAAKPVAEDRSARRDEDRVTADDLIAALAAESTESPQPLDALDLDEPQGEPQDVAAEPSTPLEPEPQPQPKAQAPEKEQPPTAQPWGNQENVLGGMPLHLPEPPPAPFGSVPISESAAGGPPFAVPIPSVGLAASRRRARQDQQAAASAEPGESPEARDELDIPAFDPSAHHDSEIHGLSGPPVREADVFACASPQSHDADGMEDAESPVSSDEARELVGLGDWNRGGAVAATLPAIKAPTHRRNGVPPAPPQAIPLRELEQAALHKRRQRLRRVPLLLGAMLLLIVVVCILIWQFGPVRHVMEAAIRFNIPDGLTQRDRNSFQEGRIAALSSAAVLNDARNRLRLWDPSVPAGFLETPQGLSAVLNDARWDRGRLLIRTESADEAQERLRLRALLAAAWEVNQPLLQQMRQARSARAALEQQLLRDKATLDALGDQIRRLTAMADAAPSDTAIRELEAAVEQAEQAWEASRLVVREHRDALRALRDAPAADVGPLDAPAAAGAGEDARIAEMTQALQDLQRQLDAGRRLNHRRAEEARQALDASVEQFQQQVAAAQGIAQGNPELEKYLAAAQELQKTTRQVIDELIRRQEQQSGRLAELRARLAERMEARRTELWQGDKQLQDLTEQLAITTRLLNTAIGSGQQSEAEDLRAQVDLLKSLIKARQELLPGDPFFAEAILQISELIDTAQKNIEQDRRRADQALEQVQRAFTASAPSVEKLPQEQRELAEAMAKRLADINAARRKYSEALDAAGAQTDAQLQQQVQALQAGIDARRRQLAEDNRRNLTRQQEQQRLAAIEQRAAELEAAEQAESEARAVFFARDRDLREARQNAERALATREQLAGLRLQHRELSASYDLLLKQVELKTAQAAMAIEPLPPGDSDIARIGGVDRRPLYAGVTSGGILLVFMAWILWTLNAAARDIAAIPSISVGDDQDLPGDKPTAQARLGDEDSPRNPDRDSGSASPDPATHPASVS